MAFIQWLNRQNRTGVSFTAAVPITPELAGNHARLQLDTTDFADPAQTVSLTLEVSADNGATWSLWIGATFQGGPLPRPQGLSRELPPAATHARARVEIGGPIAGSIVLGVQGEVEARPPQPIEADPHHSATHDASSSGSAANATSITVAHTCSGTDRCLFVGITTKDEATTSRTYAGVALTSVGQIANGTSCRSELWQLVAPATGANNIVANFGETDVVLGGESMTGVDQTTPTGTAATATGTSTAPSVNVSGATDDLAVDCMSAVQQTATVGAGQTQRWNATGGTSVRGAGSTEPGAATVTMSWTLGASVAWAIVAVAAKAAGGAPPAGPPTGGLALMGVGK